MKPNFQLGWKKSRYPAGTEVNVSDIHDHPLGKGTLLYDYDLNNDNHIYSVF